MAPKNVLTGVGVTSDSAHCFAGLPRDKYLCARDPSMPKSKTQHRLLLYYVQFVDMLFLAFDLS